MFPATYNKIIKIQPNTKTVKFRCCLSAIQMIKKYSRILDLRSIFLSDVKYLVNMYNAVFKHNESHR